MSVKATENLSSRTVCTDVVDASCRLPLIALFGVAAVWLIVGLALALIASLTFHNPEMFDRCSFLTYGHVAAAANDALVYGFAIPAAFGVMLWIFARLSQVELVLPLVPFVAANLWFLGVLAGLGAIFAGESTGYAWLEFPRAAAVILFAAFLLIAISAVATFGQRKERELYPSHWFLLAALLWFPWIYSSANLLLLPFQPVRGVGQAVINWWFANNLVFIWLALVGLGVAFYFLPKLGGKPLFSRFYAQFAFWTLLLFGTWCGIPHGAPVPAWYPTMSAVCSALLIVPLLVIAIIYKKTVSGAQSECRGGSFCYIKFGTVAFLISGLMIVASACPHFSVATQFTWFQNAQTNWQILGFFATIILGAAYDILPRIMGIALPFPKFVRFQHWLFILGNLILLVTLVGAGLKQGTHDYNLEATLPFLRAATLGWLFLLLGSLMFAANIFVMTLKWKMTLVKTMIVAVKAPLTTTAKTSEVKS
jgi:cytochrome c oxidase cbb3-type subunit 1